MPSKKGRDIIVIGTSAGGLDALDEVVGRLPTDIPATIFIVQHLNPETTGEALLWRLGRHKAFHCKLAENGETFRRGRIYIAPPDAHMLVKETKIVVSCGARENRYRPAIDPLFRSAAVTHGPGVIGVILTGMLDDGTAGLMAVRRCGGVTIVQDPKEAAYPEMPQSAINNLKVDHCLPVAEIGPLLEKLCRENHRKVKSIPRDVQTEARIAERVVGDMSTVPTLGKQVPYTCPGCGGVLWEMDTPDLHRFRCHTGHSFTAAALLLGQSEQIEETLWIALRMFEERKNLLNNMSQREVAHRQKSAYAKRARENDVHIERIRAMLSTTRPERTITVVEKKKA